MGCTNSTAVPALIPSDGEVEAGAEDPSNSTSSTSVRRQEEEESFADLDLEELGVQETTLRKLDTLHSDHTDKLTTHVVGHFSDNEEMDAHALGCMLGLCPKSARGDSGPPVFVQKLHNALLRHTKKNDYTEGEAMDVTEVVEALLHMHSHAGDVESQANFLYEHIYSQPTTDGDTGSLSTSDVKLTDSKDMSTSIVESAADIQEFQKEFKQFGVLDLEGGLDIVVQEVLNEYLQEQLGGEDVVSRQTFHSWVAKCQQQRNIDNNGNNNERTESREG